MGFLFGMKIKRWISKNEVQPLMKQFRKLADKKSDQTEKKIQQQKEIVRSLGKIGNRTAVGELVMIAKATNKYLKINYVIRLLAVKTLGKIHSSDGLEGLENILKEWPGKTVIKTLLDTKSSDGVQVIAQEFLTGP